MDYDKCHPINGELNEKHSVLMWLKEYDENFCIVLSVHNGEIYLDYACSEPETFTDENDFAMYYATEIKDVLFDDFGVDISVEEFLFIHRNAKEFAVINWPYINNYKNPLLYTEIDAVSPFETRTNRNMAKCPIHKEETASFVFVPQAGSYHCLGCGAQGNSVNDLLKQLDERDLKQEGNKDDRTI